MHDAPEPSTETADNSSGYTEPCCPVCGGRLFDIRSKQQCSQCHRICETCCEGGRG